MKTIIKNKNTISEKDNIIILSNKKSKLTNFNLSSDEIKYVIKQQKSNKEIIVLNQYTRKIIIINPEDKIDIDHEDDLRIAEEKLKNI